jgi:hypothetical protein
MCPDREYYIKNKELIKAKSREYYRTHKEERSNYMKQWKKDNPEKVKEEKKRYRENHKQEIKEYNKNRSRERNERKKERKRTEPKFALDERISKQFWTALKKKKNSKKWEEMAGYSLDELYNHINSKFRDGMTWEKFLEGKIEIDHIIPKKYFIYETPLDIEFKSCWSLENLQPLWAFENSSKGDKLIIGNKENPQKLTVDMFQNKELKRILIRALENP